MQRKFSTIRTWPRPKLFFLLAISVLTGIYSLGACFAIVLFVSSNSKGPFRMPKDSWSALKISKYSLFWGFVLVRISIPNDSYGLLTIRNDCYDSSGLSHSASPQNLCARRKSFAERKGFHIEYDLLESLVFRQAEFACAASVNSCLYAIEVF